MTAPGAGGAQRPLWTGRDVRWLLARWRDLHVDRSGLWFPYRGDVALWVYPWRRRGSAWVSLLCEGEFPTLRALDAFWVDWDRIGREGRA